MKRLITLILLFATTVAYSQKVEISAGVGISTNTLPKTHYSYGMSISSKNLINLDDRRYGKPNIGYATTLKFKYNFKMIQAGIGIDAHSLGGREEVNKIDINGNPIGTERVRVTYANPMLAIYALANIRFLKGLYAGVHIGYANAQKDKNIISTHLSKPFQILQPTHYGGNGYLFGAQVGFNKKVATRINFFTELNIRNYTITFEDFYMNTEEQYSVLAFPLTAGVTVGL